MKLTNMQRSSLAVLASYDPGEWVSFGYDGYGRTTVSLRALHHKDKSLVMYESRDGEEYFCITGEGRGVLTSGERHGD